MAFDYLEGGAGSEANITRNRSAFDNITLVPEYLRDVSKINRSVEVFGKTYSAPIGIAPVGLSNLIWPNLDISLAAMAREANIPYVLSAAGTSSIETMADIAGDNLWFQLYVSKQDEISLDLIRRSREVGIRVLVVTVDIPVPSLRLRDIRNGFTLPFRMTPRTVLDIVAHPSWAIGTLRAGTPRFENMAPYMKEAASGQSLAAAMAMQNTSKPGRRSYETPAGLVARQNDHKRGYVTRHRQSRRGGRAGRHNCLKSWRSTARQRPRHHRSGAKHRRCGWRPGDDHARQRHTDRGGYREGLL